MYFIIFNGKACSVKYKLKTGLCGAGRPSQSEVELDTCARELFFDPLLAIFRTDNWVAVKLLLGKTLAH